MVREDGQTDTTDERMDMMFPYSPIHPSTQTYKTIVLRNGLKIQFFRLFLFKSITYLRTDTDIF